jgi:hypothetical protein
LSPLFPGAAQRMGDANRHVGPLEWKNFPNVRARHRQCNEKIEIWFFGLAEL